MGLPTLPPCPHPPTPCPPTVARKEPRLTPTSAQCFKARPVLEGVNYQMSPSMKLPWGLGPSSPLIGWSFLAWLLGCRCCRGWGINPHLLLSGSVGWGRGRWGPARGTAGQACLRGQAPAPLLHTLFTFLVLRPKNRAWWGQGTAGRRGELSSAWTFALPSCLFPAFCRREK